MVELVAPPFSAIEQGCDLGRHFVKAVADKTGIDSHGTRWLHEFFDMDTFRPISPPRFSFEIDRSYAAHVPAIEETAKAFGLKTGVLKIALKGVFLERAMVPANEAAFNAVKAKYPQVVGDNIRYIQSAPRFDDEGKPYICVSFNDVTLWQLANAQADLPKSMEITPRYGDKVAVPVLYKLEPLPVLGGPVQ